MEVQCGESGVRLCTEALMGIGLQVPRAQETQEQPKGGPAQM